MKQACGTYGDKKNGYNVFVEELEVKRDILVRSGHIWVGNIFRMEFRK
jgi:hypothetical protein